MITKIDNILIYPYSYKTFSIVKLLLNNNYRVNIASFDGSGLIGKDVSYSVNRCESNAVVLQYSEDLLDTSDILYIPEFNENCVINDLIKDVLKRAIQNNKKIIVESNEKIINEFLDYSKLISLQTLINSSIASYYSKIKLYKTKFYRPAIPVIYIGGIHDLIDNDYIAIALKDYLEKNGYRTCTLSRKASNKLFGCIDFPDEFINSNNPIEDKIISLNNYIRSCVEVLKPDVLIMQIPYGMMQFNDYYHNSFGSYAYLISQAVKGDYFICCMTTELLSTNYYNELSQYFYKKYDSAIDCIHFSNCLLNIPNSIRPQNQDILFLNETHIDKLLYDYEKDSNYEMLNLFKEKDLELLYHDILRKL